MDKALISPMPAWLSAKLRHLGEQLTMVLLGYGLLESNGPQDDHRIASDYAELSKMVDPAEFLGDYYSELGTSHPWAAEHLEPLLGVLHHPPSSVYDQLSQACQLLSTVSVNGAEHLAESDLLGRVQAEMMAQFYKQTTAGYNTTMAQAEQSVVMDYALGLLPVEKLRDTTDLWAGSGMRMLGLASAMLALGMDPREHKWIMMDADPMNRAIIAVNMMAFDLLGEQITIADGTAHQQAYLASYSTTGVRFTDVWQVNPARIDGSRT